MKVTSFLTLSTLAFVGTEAWSFTVWTGHNHGGLKRHYFSLKGDNNCYNIDDGITSKGVGSFSYCSMAWARCSITMHSKAGCQGTVLGSATGNAPFSEWQKGTTSAAGSKMKSFRIQGCKEVPITGGDLDCTKCTKDP
ncbi:hypothetical protein NQ176_g6009 [Zarea fungicola]|uniref:Uncharacterized protein n=1 Tax=Zarea fungicola TaxID=93591 RepID=A0ACC1N6J3_9HYPO|nr:hypothetical protein NQ176_g6009 [Lecanicillium fungicola]